MAETESKWERRMNKKNSIMLENGKLKKEFSFDRPGFTTLLKFLR